MSIATEVSRLQTAKSELKTAIEGKGVIVGEAKLEAYPALVESIETGGGGGGTHNLPSGYTEYEYIEGTGTQYINTGYVVTENTEVVMTFMRTEKQTYNACEFGVQPTPRFVLAGAYANWGSATDKSNTAYNPDSIYGIKTIKFNKSGIYDLLGNLNVRIGSATWTSGSLPLYIMARNNDGVVQRKAKERLYAFTIYESGVKAMELVPALRKSDSVLGLYDTVSGAFLTNAGTGTFTGGAF